MLLENVSCMIIAGGEVTSMDAISAVEVLPGDLIIRQLPILPKKVDASSMILHNGKILFCGGSRNSEKCLQLDDGTWKEHSTFNVGRFGGHSVVSTNVATFVFGGDNILPLSEKTYEYLPKDSNTWIMGKTEIPGGFMHGYAIAVKSEKEIWLIGGIRFGTEKRILSFDVKNHTFKVMPFELTEQRRLHCCAFLPNTNKLMITGGIDSNSTEIIDVENGSVTKAAPMNCGLRMSHGMGIVTINGINRLIVFGGRNELSPKVYVHDNVELYNTETEKWETTSIKLKEPKYDFGFLTIKLWDIISKL